MSSLHVAHFDPGTRQRILESGVGHDRMFRERPVAAAPACPECHSALTLHYQSAIQDGAAVGVYSCLHCGKRFVATARRAPGNSEAKA
jgi:DNA-directed RNA polymerase subunit M/transcription elongation factor TFIIS